ncbi:MAG: efflux RND transporter permease subunit, partial [Acidobacteriota bacterium]
MGIIRYSIRYPITVAVGVILVSLFGLVALTWVPVQLTPTVDRPQITVRTTWPGASPQEIEREIIDEQEDQLKNVDGLLKMGSQSQQGVGTIVLEFPVGTDLDSALLRVSNRLEQVPSYPDDVDKPVLFSVDANSSAIAWFIVSALPGREIEIQNLFDYLDEEVKPRMERVAGVAQVNIIGGREREMQVIIDPDRLAVRKLTLSQVGAALAAENRDYSAGDFDEGKRRYLVRTTGDYHSPKDIENVIIATVDGEPIYVRDVARVELNYRKATGFVRHQGHPAIAMNALRESGSNILDVMEGLRAEVASIDSGMLRQRGLTIEQVYDQTDYIDAAFSLVRSNILVGGGLAVLVLILFLRTWSGTFTVAVSIPIAVVATFLVMAVMGRTINVISLAGLAFAVGMVVDNCIVVLENIVRHREMGKTRAQAALDGGTEVWGAVLASTLTTVAVFLPVIFVAEEAGQLFRDIAIAISAAVLLSLAVSITVIPTLAARLLRRELDKGAPGGARTGGSIRSREAAGPGREGAHAASVPAATEGFFARIPAQIAAAASWLNRTAFRRLSIVASLTLVSVVGSWLLMPKTEYLPTGNSNFILGIVLPPPGYNLDEYRRIAETVDEGLRRYWETAPGTAAARALPGGGLANSFFAAFGDQVFMGMRARDDNRVREILPVLQETLSRIPGAITIARQSSIFERGLETSRSIDVDLRGPRIETLLQTGGQMFKKIMDEIPGTQVRPIPSLDLGSPELRIIPDRRRMADVGLTNRELGFTVNALVDGVKVSDYRIEGREIDLVLKSDEAAGLDTHSLESIAINTPTGDQVTLGSLARLRTVAGPVQVLHLERVRAIRLMVVPPENLPLERAMEILKTRVIEPIRQAGGIPEGVDVGLAGTADDLTRTRDALMGNFLLALAITYLLMAALFQSWLYPLVIMFSVPLASLGGLLGLRLVSLLIAYQTMDVLTMLGFVILIGIVVNNAILIVHQSLNLMRDQGISAEAAIPEAVRTRVRPIFMSTATSIFGMLPLVLFHGAGSELYRGLGSVVIGGLALSTVFTLVLVPALFSL